MCGKIFFDGQTRLARRFPASTKTEGKVRTTKLVSRKVESDQGGLMSYGTNHTFLPVFPAVFLVLPG